MHFSNSSGSKRATNGQIVRSPKLRSPKELSPGIPRRPTAPREPRQNLPSDNSSKCGSGMPASRTRQRLTRDGGKRASRQQQQDYIGHRQDVSGTSPAIRRHVAVNGEKFARSQLQVKYFVWLCGVQASPKLAYAVLLNSISDCGNFSFSAFTLLMAGMVSALCKKNSRDSGVGLYACVLDTQRLECVVVINIRHSFPLLLIFGRRAMYIFCS